ncbi:MAG: hypothetical protein MUP82_06485 [Candidatus Marinimicrobia bacterium]|nr:hypothetical protein [Candidatus Neomarinimicrobiota bacterium]
MNHLLFLFLILVLALGLPLFFKMAESLKNMEGYSNYALDGAMGDYPAAQMKVLVDTYPAIGKNQLSNNSASDIWRDYPIFELGSYEQTTNNIRYPDNPDEGTCMPASMCGALYYDKKLKSNIVEPLPPLNPECGTRIGYFDTNENLLPFRSDMQNILY